MSSHSSSTASRRDWAPPCVLPAGAPASSRRNAQDATLQAGEAPALAERCCARVACLLLRPRPNERGRASKPARATGTARCRLPGTSGNFPELEARAGKGHGATPAELATPARSKCPRCCLAAGALQAAGTRQNARTLTGEALPLPSCCERLAGFLVRRTGATPRAEERPAAARAGARGGAFRLHFRLHGGYIDHAAGRGKEKST